MDAYEESLLTVLLPDGIPDSWNESKELSPYLQHLASCGVNKLAGECGQLEEEEAAVLEQTKELAYKEYFTFIHAADCSKDMLTQLRSVEESLAASCSGVQSLQDTLTGFVDTSRSLLQARQLNTTTLAKHTQLLEILELAQLLDTCVRNNYHDEALEIIAYVRRLEKRHGHIPIIQNIVSEVQSSSRQMLSQLLAQLRTDTSLPQCLKVVGLVRTLDVFTECELRVKFLQARDAWLGAALRAVPHQDAYQHLSKSIECSRVHLFDIVTQYRAIFSDDHVHPDQHHDTVDLPAILQSWILHKVSGILAMLRRDLSKGSICGANLESLLAQCMFFGQSLSRIGADFRALLPAIFQEAAGRQLERDVRTANHRLDESLSAFSLLDACAPVSQALPQSGGMGSRPPLSLLEFPPLGHYMNALVGAFNTLRLCCFTALLPLLLQLLTESLQKVVRSLMELHQLECSGFSSTETATFQRLCEVVRSALLPHINTCLGALYPRHRIAPLLATSGHQLAKMNFGQLDVDTVCAPLLPFLPNPASDATASAGGDVTQTLPGDVTQTLPGDVTQTLPGDVNQTMTGDVTASAAHGATSSADCEVTASAGDDVTSSAGDDVTASSVDDVTASSVDDCTASAVDHGTASAVDDITASAVDDVTASAVDDVTSSADGDVTTVIDIGSNANKIGEVTSSDVTTVTSQQTVGSGMLSTTTAATGTDAVTGDTGAATMTLATAVVETTSAASSAAVTITPPTYDLLTPLSEVDLND